MKDGLIKIVPARRPDLPGIAEIESECNLGKWGEAGYLSELNREDALLFVAIEQNENRNENRNAVGFVSARLIKPNVEILNIGVLPDYRKKGLGSVLLQTVLTTALKRDCTKCWLEVRQSNETAQMFYFVRGFKIVGKRRNYYADPVEDAILLEFEFGKRLASEKDLR